jgi:hypothetical protein
MPDPSPITAPAGYATAYAVGYADPAENLILVSESERLPVAAAAPAQAAMVGQSSVSTQAGPFHAVPDRVVLVTLGGVWEGTVRLLRSIDGSATLHRLRAAGEPWAEYTQPGCEQAWLETQDGASFYLDIALASGTVDYRVSQ